MIGSIVLIVLGLMLLIGIGQSSARDFGLPSIVLVLLIGAVVGLNFIPPFTFGQVSFSVGTLLFLASALFFWVYGKNIRNKIICLLITIVASALLYGSIRLADYFGSELWSQMNLYYGLMVGVITFLLTRNAKYGFVSGVISVAVVTLILSRNFDLIYTPAVLAGTVPAVLYSSIGVIIPKRPTRLSYYFETGRMLD